MSRGWESKDVESQQEEAAARRPPGPKQDHTPEELRIDNERRVLELSKVRILRELEAATMFRRQEQLRAALRHIDEKLAALK